MALFPQEQKKIGFWKKLWITISTMFKLAVVVIIFLVIGGRFIANHEGSWKDWKTSPKAAWTTLVEGVEGWKIIFEEGEADAEPQGEENAEPQGDADAEPQGEENAEPQGDADAEPQGEADVEIPSIDIDAEILSIEVDADNGGEKKEDAPKDKASGKKKFTVDAPIIVDDENNEFDGLNKLKQIIKKKSDNKR